MKKSCAITILILLCMQLVAHGQSIRWTDFEQLSDSLRVTQRPLLVFIHTDWCKYCKMQENITFQHSDVIDQLNKDYYCLRLNAEDKQDIAFLNRVYRFRSLDGQHELAKFLGKENGELIFPTTVVIKDNLQVFIRRQGLQKAEDLLQILQ